MTVLPRWLLVLALIPSPSPGAPTEASAWHAFSHAFPAPRAGTFALAVRRTGRAPDTGAAPGDPNCEDVEFVSVNGHDQAPRHLMVTSLWEFGPCLPSPEAEGTDRSPESRFHSAAVATELDVCGSAVEDGDELLLASLADHRANAARGGVFLADRPASAGGANAPDPGATWVERRLASHFAASSLAVGDVDEDGVVDVVVGTLWADPAIPLAWPDPGAASPGARPWSAPVAPEAVWVERARIGSRPRSQAVLLRGRCRDGRYDVHPPLRIGAPGALDVALADLDRDGHLDLISDGTATTVTFGPFHPGATPPVVVLASEEPGGGRSSDVAVFVDGRQETSWIASTQTCFAAGGCDPEALRVHVWRFADGAHPRVARALTGAGLDPEGLPGAVAFLPLVGHQAPALVVGRQSEILDDAGYQAQCGAGSGRLLLDPHGALGCVGAPLLLASLDQDPPILRPRELSASDSDGESRALPMTFRLLPYTNPLPDAPWHESTHRSPGPVLTYDGTGHPALVADVVDEGSGERPRYDWRPGERHLTLLEPVTGPVVVRWGAVPTPRLLAASASPLPPPHRQVPGGRGAHTGHPLTPDLESPMPWSEEDDQAVLEGHQWIRVDAGTDPNRVVLKLSGVFRPGADVPLPSGAWRGGLVLRKPEDSLDGQRTLGTTTWETIDDSPADPNDEHKTNRWDMLVEFDTTGLARGKENPYCVVAGWSSLTRSGGLFVRVGGAGGDPNLTL